MNETQRPEDCYELLTQIYEEALPFNKLLGMRVTKIDGKGAAIEIESRPDLIGNPFKQSLHGGVISAVIDAVGGLTASVGLLSQLLPIDIDKAAERFGRMGTIDLRVDFLRPALGKRYLCEGSILRTGNKVAVTRMELRDDAGTLVASGTGSYLVG